MATETELLAKLSDWLRAQPGPVSIFTVIETGDGELLAAYVLVAFRIAARHAVIDRFDRAAGSVASHQPDQSSNIVLRMFDILVEAWRLTGDEQVALLGLADLGELRRLRSSSEAKVPTEVIERVAILLDIFTAIHAILQKQDRADAWMRKPNQAPIMGGKSAIEMMAERGLDEGLRALRGYLWSNL